MTDEPRRLLKDVVGERMGLPVEPRYTLAEAEVLLREKMRRESCLVGPSAPGHDVQEYVTRNFRDEICLWSMGCRRCGATFVAQYRDDA